MSAALAGALATAMAANSGARTAAAHAREGPAQRRPPRHDRKSGSAPPRVAALKLRSRPVEASGGPLCPLTPIGVRTGGFRSKRETSSPSRYVSQQVLLAGQLAGYIDLPGAALQRHHNSLALELTSVLSQPIAGRVFFFFFFFIAGEDGLDLLPPLTIFRLTIVRKWITDGRVGREEQRDASGGLTIRCASVAFAAR